MTSRVLPREEWPRLTGTELETSWPYLDPVNAQIVVVERGDAIVACWALMRVVHVEGVWIAPEYRGAFGVVKRLLAAMRGCARAWGASYVWTGAISDDVRALIGKLGGKPIPFDCYAMPIPREGGR